MDQFVHKDSILKKIWGKGDTILFIFAGSAAEFALNKAVDWLYFTGQLPKDPIGRLFSTVSYARRIIFSDEDTALKTIDTITHIHTAVEKSRKDKIPEWAYRDVLYMLIHYSIAAYEVLERKLTDVEKQEVYSIFLKMGRRMNIPDLPPDYKSWIPVRYTHMRDDLARSKYTDDLFLQYRKHLGAVRYKVLIEGQKLIVPETVEKLLNFTKPSRLKPLVFIYKIARAVGMEWMIKKIILPGKYMKEIKELDVL